MGTGPVIANSMCSWRCVAKQTGQCLPTDAKSCQTRSPQLRQTAVKITKPAPLFPASINKRNADSHYQAHLTYDT